MRSQLTLKYDFSSLPHPSISLAPYGIVSCRCVEHRGRGRLVPFASRADRRNLGGRCWSSNRSSHEHGGSVARTTHFAGGIPATTALVWMEAAAIGGRLGRWRLAGRLAAAAHRQ